MDPFKTLIVDDSATFRKVLTETLRVQFPAMVIEGAEDGKEVFSKCEALLPDLIFMDIQLPGENGLELTRKIKREYPEIVVVILTNYDLLEYREAAQGIGANYFLTKGSATTEEILTLVSSILSDLGFNLHGSKSGVPPKRMKE